MPSMIVDAVTQRTYQREFPIAEANNSTINDEFEEYVDLIDSVRGEKDYDWMSDVRLPEFISHMLTQTSLDVDQYFSSRDFTDVYIEDESDEAVASAGASKELINRTLNRRKLYHYPKFVRGKIINHLSGRVNAICWWEKKMVPAKVGERISVRELDTDVYGEPITDESVQVRDTEELIEDIMGEIPKIDCFNYEIIDPRNIFTSNKYTYTIQDQPYVYVRTERTLEELNDEAENQGYINLDELGKNKRTSSTSETKTSMETYNKTDGHQKVDSHSPEYDIIHRYGKFWCIADEVDDFGNPISISYGINSNGEKLENAEMHELIMTWAVSGSDVTLIRYIPTPYIDSHGNPYRPLIQGLCYIHPTSSRGVGDGRHVKELQYALDDTFNMNNDRVKLATFPTFKIKQLSYDHNPNIYMEPGHNIPLEDIGDLEELIIKDNADGALKTIQMIKDQMQQVDSIYPTTMGNVPGFASTTATAVAGAGIQSTKRSNYKNLTFENTFLSELYWMIQQMTWQFAHEDTARKLMGDKLLDFNPQLDYFYKPVSQSIETEQSKQAKITNWTTILGYLVNIQHPSIPKLINMVVAKVSALMGDEYVDVVSGLLDESQAIQGPGGAPPAEQAALIGSPSNQNGLPISGAEQLVRQ